MHAYALLKAPQGNRMYLKYICMSLDDVFAHEQPFEDLMEIIR